MSSTTSSIPLALLVLCCLLSTFRIVKTTPHQPDSIALRSDQRFARLEAALPQRGTVGYIGESGNLAVGDYYLAQYALAPLVVDNSANHPLVIANFPNTQPAAPAGNFHLVKDFGNGILLFAQKDLRKGAQ